MTLQLDKEFNYWKKLLGRLNSVIKFIATRGLAFRGDNQQLSSIINGNYLGFVELIGKYDPFLKNYIM